MYYSEYVIEWEDDPIGDQLGGYFINYNNQTHDRTFALYGGPTWFWYSGGLGYTVYNYNNSPILYATSEKRMKNTAKIRFRANDNLNCVV